MSPGGTRRRSGGRLPGIDRTEAARRYQEEVARLQRNSIRLLRYALANFPILFAAISSFMIFDGQVTAERMIPHALIVIGGALGISTYVLSGRPRRAWQMLAAALVVGGLGFVSLLWVSMAVER